MSAIGPCGREWNVMEETYLIDQIKKYVSYVSVDFEADMRVARCVSDPAATRSALALWRVSDPAGTQHPRATDGGNKDGTTHH